MKTRNIRLTTNALAMAIVTVLGVVGCSSTSAPTAKLSKPTSGMITGFGSVFVNGVEYDTTQANVSAKGAASSESALQVGMVVKVVGSIDANGTTGTADSIAYTDDVEGIVSANTVATNNQLVVMGQTVMVDAKTRFKSFDALHLSPADVAVNAIVEVSGYSSGAGAIYATRLEEKKMYVAGDAIELKGVVSALDSVAKTFTIGALTIDYSGAASFPSNLANNLYVEVKSTSAPVGSLWSASSVAVEDDGKMGEQGQADDEVELNGVIVTIAADNSSFTLNGQPIGLTANTEYNNKLVIAVGQNVKVEAKFDANGNPVAKNIELIPGSGATELSAQGAISLVASDNITVGGILYYVNNMTVYEDESVAANRYLRIGNLATGDNVKLKYYFDNALQKNIVIALERY